MSASPKPVSVVEVAFDRIAKRNPPKTRAKANPRWREVKMRGVAQLYFGSLCPLTLLVEGTVAVDREVIRINIMERKRGSRWTTYHDDYRRECAINSNFGQAVTFSYERSRRPRQGGLGKPSRRAWFDERAWVWMTWRTAKLRKLGSRNPGDWRGVSRLVASPFRPRSGIELKKKCTSEVV